MSEISESEESQQMRDYCLELLTEEETFRAESVWLGNEVKINRLEIVRDDLIDDYLNAHLNAGEKYAFETNFLAIPANAEMVAIAKTLRKLIDAKTVAAFDAETASRVAPAVSLGEKMRAVFFPNRAKNVRLVPSLLGGFAVVLAILTVGFFVVSRQFSTADSEIAKTENVDVPVQTSPNFDFTGNQVPPNVNKIASENTNADNLKRENEANNLPKKNSKRESDAVDSKQPSKSAERLPMPPLVQNQTLMGEGSGAGCILQIGKSAKSVSVALLNGEKPTAVEIKLAGEQNPLLILPVKIKSGQKILSVTFPVKELEQGKKYRFTLLGVTRPRSYICEVNKTNP